mmetsp:Transcript_1285/g.1592  ORF Transcript_1285/g.1592 Transcript_1285/m.1592 type:complete len:92 (+) Transcript_1285:45-320(+)
MTRGTPAQGGRRTKSHTLSRTNGRQCFHKQKKRCARTGGGAKTRRYNWATKAIRRRGQGTGRMSHLRNVARRAKNNFREGTKPTAVKRASN